MPSPGSAVALSVKPTSAKDAQWVQKVASAGTPVIADLCDNVFIEGYGDQGTTIGDRIKGMCQYLAAMTVPTTALREEGLRAPACPWSVPCWFPTSSRRRTCLYGSVSCWEFRRD